MSHSSANLPIAASTQAPSQSTNDHSAPTTVSPDAVLQLGLGFWASKTLLTAVELGVFTSLASGPQTAEELTRALAMQRRGAVDFLDALVALGMLNREGGAYRNTVATNMFLDRSKASYLGGILEMANARLYPFWGSLTEALRTGLPQNEAKYGQDPFAAIYADPDRLRQFLKAMTGISTGAAVALAEAFPWAQYSSFVDVGTAEGCLPVQLVLRHPHLMGCGFDLPPVASIFADYVASFGVADRLAFTPGDFFTDPLPRADVLVLGRVLHDWDLEQKRTLLHKAYKALPEGGAVIVYDAVIDDERRSNAFGLLMSLNMLIETPGGFDYTGADCRGWLAEVGFHDSYVQPLIGPDSLVVGIK